MKCSKAITINSALGHPKNAFQKSSLFLQDICSCNCNCFIVIRNSSIFLGFLQVLQFTLLLLQANRLRLILVEILLIFSLKNSLILENKLFQSMFAVHALRFIWPNSSQKILFSTLEEKWGRKTSIIYAANNCHLIFWKMIKLISSDTLTDFFYQGLTLAAGCFKDQGCGFDKSWVLISFRTYDKGIC